MSEDCPNCVFEKTEDNCRGCFEGSHYKPKPITNADYIRAMSDEELADYLRYYSDSYARYDMDWFDWLKQEVKDNE